MDTKLGLIQDFLREKPEPVASVQGGEPGTPACLKAENMLGCKTKIRLFSLSFDCELCKDEKALVNTQNLGRL